MILKSRYGGDVKMVAREGEWGYESLIPLPGSAFLSAAGVPVTLDTALGMPAVGNIIRSVGDLCSVLPFITYENRQSREKDDESWQWDVLHDKPSDEVDPFQFWYDVFVSMESCQNAFIQKAKLTDGQVVEVYVIDPMRVRCYVNKDSGRKNFDVYNSPTDVTYGLTTDDILHVRGYSPQTGGPVGVSLFEIHRNPLGSAIALQQFEGDYFANGAQPPFWFTGMANKQQAQDVLDYHNSQHKGAGRQWKPGALWGNSDVKSLPVSAKDAMYIEAKNMAIEDVCRIMRWPRRLLELGEQAPVRVSINEADSELLKIYVLPRLKRVESAFNADPDFYYGHPEFGEFLTDALERGDVHTRYDAYRLARQGGWTTANEIREKENLPPRPDGDELQQTPVGGAPNLNKAPAQPPPTPAQPPGGGEPDAEVEPPAGRNGHDIEASDRIAAIVERGGT